MTDQTNDAGSSAMSALADTGATIHIEHPADGAVLVRVTYPADPTGLTLETYAGRRHTTRHLPRSHIADLAPAFSYYRGPHSLFRCWLHIQTTSPRSTLRCLHNLGGNHLAHIANTLRLPLNLPPPAPGPEFRPDFP